MAADEGKIVTPRTHFTFFESRIRPANPDWGCHKQGLLRIQGEILKFTKEKKAWFQEREDAEKEMEAKKKNLMKTQVNLRKYHQ